MSRQHEFENPGGWRSRYGLWSLVFIIAVALALAMSAWAQEEMAGIVEPVSARDHLRGAREAPVKLIEFGDTECPLCKRFHPTLKRIVDEYPGKVAWVFRHFPIVEIHPKAPKEAEATECAAELGGEVDGDALVRYFDQSSPPGVSPGPRNRITRLG